MLFQEVFLRELVRDGFEERLVVMLSASESEELDTIVIEINLGADQPVWPVAGDGVRVSKDGDLSHVGGAADKEDSSPEARLEIEFPASLMRTARRWRSAARYWLDRCRNCDTPGCSKRCQTFACQSPLKLSMAAWNPVSFGGAKTGVTPRLRHRRMTRPTASGCWRGPVKRLSLSN